ncbi:hypothetical protein TNCV_2490771 [Trichonephila clavipes]|nr:hypothetical protein TNCV_2490771 [Trichonephila clavipes]
MRLVSPLDAQGGKWHFSEILKQYKFFKKTLEDITLRAFELREDEGKICLENRQEKKINILLDRNEKHVSNQGRAQPSLNNRLTRVINPNSNVSLQDEPAKKQDCQKENFNRRRRNILNLVTKFG